METRWLDEADEVSAFCDTIDGQVMAIDSESDHFHAYQARVCLLQVATREQTALIDPLALSESDLEPLFEVCRDPDVTKIFHSAHNDLNEFDRDWGLEVEGLFDTQIAARFLGYRRNSFSWLIEEILDWTTRPLPDGARRYAATDAIHLLPLYDRFEEELDESGWREPFEQQCRYVAETTSYEPKPFDPEGWRKIDQGAELEGDQRAIFRALYLWRHELCSELNRAAIHVFPNDVMAEVARREIDSRDALAELDRLPDETVEAHADELLKAVERGRKAEIPPDAPSNNQSSRGRRFTDEERARYNALRDWRNRTAEELDIPTEFVATNDTLSDIAADPPADVDDLRKFRPILEWQRQMFGDEIVEIATD